ncbi:MFS transporter [Micromonospora qiuiae]|uniref:MFS transporter n=1 Tax=Micromonospora qiuiae TaxID=502268 RepID=UPI001950D486|nr:MFS transporter [Micromonospora qiuiae]
MLFGYGLGALIGITIGGRTADRYPRAILGFGFAGLLITSALLAFAAAHLVATIVLVFALGLIGFSTNPALNSRFMAIAPNAPTLAVSGNISAFNIGITAGPWLGGLALTAGYDYPAVPAIGAAVAAIALALWGWDLIIQTRQHRAHAPTLEPTGARG